METTTTDTIRAKTLRWYAHAGRMNEQKVPEEGYELSLAAKKEKKSADLLEGRVKEATAERNLQNEDWRIWEVTKY